MKNLKKSLLFTLLCISIFACGEKEINEEEAVESNALKSSEKTQVLTAKAEKATFYYYINANGKFESGRDQLLLAETSGKINRLYVTEGQRVNAGDLLMALDDTEAKLKVKKAEIALETAKLNFENELLGSPSLSTRIDAESDAIRDRIKLSGGVSSAEVDLESAQLELQRHQIKAAYNGIISDLKVSEKEYISSGKEICRLYENEKMILRAKVLENDIHLIDIGMPVNIKVAAQNESVNGKIRNINPRVDENGMSEVSIIVENAKVLPGMSAVAEIKVPKQKTLIVPKDAVVIRSGRPVVFTIEKGIAKWNYVKTGLDNGREVEVLEGIEEGMTVITTNNLQLAHDAPVAYNQE